MFKRKSGLSNKYTMLIIYLVICESIYPQNFHSPESIVFDSMSKSYFVSNFGDGSIIKIDSNGVLSNFQKGLSQPMGLTICNNVLYIVTLPNKIIGYNLESNKRVFEIIVDESEIMNDITSDNIQYLYVTDIKQNMIFRINIISKSYDLFLETPTEAPNGIVYDKTNNRLLVCYFNENASIDEICLKNIKITTLINSKYSNFDGITLDEVGNLYASSFGTGDYVNGFNKDGTVLKFYKDYKDEPIILLDNLHGSADIYYNKSKTELAIPLFYGNDVVFYKIE